MSGSVIPFPKTTPSAAFGRASSTGDSTSSRRIDGSLAVVTRALDELQVTIDLGAMAADAVNSGDLERMVAIRDRLIARLEARAAARAQRMRRLG